MIAKLIRKKRQAYWASLESDLPLGTLPVGASDLSTTVRIRRTEHSRPAQGTLDRMECFVQGRHLLATGKSDRCLTIDGVGEFFLGQGMQEIQYRHFPGGTSKLIGYWLLHSVLPFHLFSQRSLEFLHASAVAIGRLSAAFLAPSHGGKSTLAEYFVRRGHPLITDDKLGILQSNGQYLAVPGVPFLRPYRRSEDLGYRIENFAREPLPLGTLYVLQAKDPEAPIKIREHSPAEASWALTQNWEFRIASRIKERFEYFADLVACTRVCSIEIPRDPARLPQVYTAVCQDLDGLKQPSAQAI